MTVFAALALPGLLTLAAGSAAVAARFGADSRNLADRPGVWSPDAVAWDDGAWLAGSPAQGSTPDVAPRTGARPSGRRLLRRLGQLYAGLVLYGVSMAFLVRAQLGVMPWDVLHQGLARWVHVSLGAVAIAVGAVVLLGWVPLRQRPGVGTVSNVVVIGLVVDGVLAVLPAPSVIGWRVLFVVLGIGANAVATAAYIGARLGPGPRDGLMTGLVARTGWPVRVVRTGIEVSVVAAGWLLGGNLGPATLLYAVAVGPLVQPLLPRFAVAEMPVPGEVAPHRPGVTGGSPAEINPLAGTKVPCGAFERSGG